MERKNYKWTVGVTTAPRPQHYLDQTLSSLSEAGFEDITIFAEPDTPIPETFSGPIVHRPKRYGDWTNWATGFYELLLSHPESDLFLMTEDDVIINRFAKTYLESAFPTLKEFASLSFYTPSKYAKKEFKGFHNELKGEFIWSTVTVIMTRKQAISFFSSSLVQRHRFEDIFDKPDTFWCCPNTDPRNSIKDAVIGKWAESQQLPVYYHTPSLAEHIGHQSLLTNQEASVENSRKSLDFIGQDTNILDWCSEIKVRHLAKVPLY